MPAKVTVERQYGQRACSLEDSIGTGMKKITRGGHKRDLGECHTTSISLAHRESHVITNNTSILIIMMQHKSQQID